MRKRTKILIKLWINIVLILVVIGWVIGVNVIRLNDNFYSNHEKAVDYGRIKDDFDLIRPIIAAVFYSGKTENDGKIMTYFNHADNYEMKNVKMVVVPRQLSNDGFSVVEKLYEKIQQNNKISRILAVHDKNADVKSHTQMLQRVITTAEVKEYPVAEKNLADERAIIDYLNTAQSVVVFLADLDKGIFSDESDFLIGEVLYFAKQYFYNVNVFDVIDTKMAKFLEKDYQAIYPLEPVEDEPVLLKQQRNLVRYKLHYGKKLIDYMEANRGNHQGEKNWFLPKKNEENYRLFDRGRISVKAYDEDYVEIFESTKLQQDEGIIISAIEIAQDLVTSGKDEKARYFKIYLLTEMEKVRKNADSLLAEYLDPDDGVYVEYKDKSAVMVADDRPDNPDELVQTLRKKAGIEIGVDEDDIDFYKFKTVEIDYGD